MEGLSVLGVVENREAPLQRRAGLLLAQPKGPYASPLPPHHRKPSILNRIC